MYTQVGIWKWHNVGMWQWVRFVAPDTALVESWLEYHRGQDAQHIYHASVRRPRVAPKLD